MTSSKYFPKNCCGFEKSLSSTLTQEAWEKLVTLTPDTWTGVFIPLRIRCHLKLPENVEGVILQSLTYLYLKNKYTPGWGEKATPLLSPTTLDGKTPWDTQWPHHRVPSPCPCITPINSTPNHHPRTKDSGGYSCMLLLRLGGQGLFKEKNPTGKCIHSGRCRHKSKINHRR